MMIGQGEYAGNHLKAVDGWYAVWCHEYAYKVEMSDTKTMLSAAVRDMGGTLVRKKNPSMFYDWWLNTEHSDSPYVLILHWRETKPCYDFLEKELAKGHVHKMPRAIYVVSQAGKAFRHASSWVSCRHHLKATVAQEMTRDGLQSWLSGRMNNKHCGARPLVGRHATCNNQEWMQYNGNLKTIHCHEHADFRKVRVDQQLDQDMEVPVKIGSRGTKVQFSFGSFAVTDLVQALQNPHVASWLDCLLVKNMPEIYTD